MMSLVQSIRNARHLPRTMVGGLVAAFLLLLAMEACPAFHQFLHQDANHNDHECAVTLFQSGSCDSAPVIVYVTGGIAPLPFLIVPAAGRQWVPALFLEHQVLEHAPPACA